MPSTSAGGEFFKFCLVGAANTLLDFGVYFALTRRTDAFAGRFVVASGASFMCAVASSFVLNTFWTFGAGGDGWLRRLPRFVTIAMFGLAINAGMLWFFLALGAHDLLAKAGATAVVLCWNFTLQKWWTFKSRGMQSRGMQSYR